MSTLHQKAFGRRGDEDVVAVGGSAHLFWNASIDRLPV